MKIINSTKLIIRKRFFLNTDLLKKDQINRTKIHVSGSIRKKRILDRTKNIIDLMKMKETFQFELFFNSKIFRRI